jgi:mannose-6-phosphate isomerase-like protein (cupin superfamily)
VTAAEVQKIFKLTTPDKSADEMIRSLDIGPYNISVNLQRRAKIKDEPGSKHTKITEIYYILNGTGYFLTGGTIGPDAKANSYSPERPGQVGPGFRGTFQNPGLVNRKVGPGDTVIVPPNTGHSWSLVEDHIEYLIFRVDAEHVIPAGFVHEALQAK